jgi:tetratricopeptide (TPR) repeat protein
MAADDLVAASRLGVALHRFWLVTRSYIGDAVERLRALAARLAAAHDAPHPPHAPLFSALGLLTGVLSDLAASRHYFEAALAAAEAGGDADAVATVRHHLGWSAYLLGDYERAAAHSRAALDHFLARDGGAGRATGAAVAHNNLGWVALVRGDLDAAEAHFAEALAIHRQCGDLRSAAYVTTYLGVVAHRRCEFARVVALHEEAMTLGAPFGDPVFRITGRAWLLLGAAPRGRGRRRGGVRDRRDPGAARDRPAVVAGASLLWLAIARLDDGALAGARAAAEESAAFRRATGEGPREAECDAVLAEVARRGGDRRGAAARWRASLERRAALGEAITTTECLEGVALLALDGGDDAAAARLLAAAAAERARLGAPLPPRYRAEHAAALAGLEHRLGAVAFARLRAEAAAAPVAALVESARAVCDATRTGGRA